jgi:hypothetical protein
MRTIMQRDFNAQDAIQLNEVTGFHPYATHYHNKQDGGRYHGHYFKTLEEAREDYAIRCELEASRNECPRGWDTVEA